MIIIYQIGSLPLYSSLHSLGGSGIQIKRGWDWDAPEIDFTGLEGGVSLLPPASALLKNSEVSLSGVLVNTPDIKMMSALNYLKSLGGRRNVQIIGAQIADKSADDGEYVFASGDITWLVCDAVITSVKIDEVWEGDTMTTSHIPLTIKCKLFDYWKILSPLYWEYLDRGMSAINPHGSETQPHMGNTTFGHPTNFSELLPGYVFFRWPSTLSEMSPTMWDSKYDGHLGGEGSDFVPFGTVDILVDPQAWQSSNSLTAFTGLVSTETIEMVVTKPSGPFKEDLIEEISSLDLATTDADLAFLGYFGLRGTDILYTGFVDPLPGYVVRDGIIISGLSLRWDYPSSYPGEFANGSVTVEYRGSLGAVAYLHDYLTY